MTDFEKVVDFNWNFGTLPSRELKPLPDILETNPGLVQDCLRLIREEVRELEDAVVDKDFTEVVDALADIIYVVHGMSSRIGVNMDRAFALVHDNNMAKLCSSEDEARARVADYEAIRESGGTIGIGNNLYDSPAYRLAPDAIHWVVYNASTRKVLKAVNHPKVDLTSVCQ
jgi:hypothetical protein